MNPYRINAYDPGTVERPSRWYQRRMPAWLGALVILCVASGVRAQTAALRVNGVKFGANDTSIYVPVYGAKGDGSTDDTTALQAALTAFTTGTLYLPTGNYKVTASLTKTLAAGKTMRIVGLGAVTISSTVAEPGGEAGVLDFQGTSTSNLLIENITITQSGGIATAGNLNGVYVHNSSPGANTFGDVTMRSVKVSGVSNQGIRLAGISSGMIDNCQANSNNYAGLSMTGSQNVVVTGGTYSSNGYSGGAGDYGVTLTTQNSYGGNSNILIQGVTANNNFRKGIDVHDGVNVAIIGNFITFTSGGANASPAGIYAVNEGTTKNVRDVKIVNNFVDCSGATGGIFGITAGSFGTTSTAFGTLEISGNTVQNTAFSSSQSAIYVYNPTAGGTSVQPEKVILANNIVRNGTGGFNATGKAIVQIGEPTASFVKWKEVIVQGNALHSATATAGVYSAYAEKSTIIGNTISVDGNTVANGIFTDSADVAIVQGNNMYGAATYTISVSTNAGTTRSNILNGANIADAGLAYATSAATFSATPTGALTLTAGSASTWDTKDGGVKAATFDRTTAGLVTLGGATATSVSIGNSTVTTNVVTGQQIQFSPSSVAAGVTAGFRLTPPNYTAITAGSEVLSSWFRGNSATWSTGALATQRFYLFDTPTINFAGASTATNAATVAIAGAPVVGTNASITNRMSLWVVGGAVNLAEATVSQATNVNTGVTVNGASIVITTQSASTAVRTAETGFTVTNNAVLAASQVNCGVSDYSGTMFTNGQPDVIWDTVAAGSFHLRIINRDATGALSGTMKIHCSVL